MRSIVRNERGVALILTLLITLAIAALAMGGVMISSSGSLTAKFTAKEAALHSLADAGLEIARDSINRALTLLPDSGYITVAPASAIVDAQGNTVSGYTRTVYAGKTGGRTGGPATSGQYGSNFMSVVSVITDVRGAVAARRGLFTQESWSRFAVAIDNWSNGGVVYGCGESISGPFHSNNNLQLQGGCGSPKVDFAGPVTVVNSISNVGSGNFMAGYTTGAPALAWPTPAQLALMQAYAQQADAIGGDYDITGGNSGTAKPCTRLDFQVLDSNADGVIQWDEGYVRVLKCRDLNDTSLAFVSAKRWPAVPAGLGAYNVTNTRDPNFTSLNCGKVVGGVFQSAYSVYTNTAGGTAAQVNAARAALNDPAKVCYLGGDPRLTAWSTGSNDVLADSLVISAGMANNHGAKWIPRRSGAHSSVTAVRPTIAGGGDAEYWIPLGKNPNFKGVIYVTGDVGISGRLRGRVSVVATGNIVLQDDFLYWTTPGTDCSETGDIFGALAVGNVIIQDNNLQTPFRVNNTYRAGFDDTPSSVNDHMFFLTLSNYGGEIPGIPVYSGNPANPGIPGGMVSACQGAASGCFRVTGGMALGRLDWWTYWPTGSSNSSGWAEAHSYDPCGASNPPPYFPTTGRFVKSRYYELDPVWLNQTGIASYFQELQSR